MDTYKQEVKEFSRNLIWKHSIESLTKNRTKSAILNEEYIDKLWNFVFKEGLLKYGLIESVNKNIFEDWKSFSKQIYQENKSENQLKVAYLCGPEPENDLKHIIELGVRIENVYAFEMEKDLYQTAIKSLKNTYPTLKIYNGKIDNFIKSTNVKFDIIYLDFTTPLFSRQSKAYQTIATLFENQALENLSSLIVNTSYPDKDEDNIDFLTSYFHYQSSYEYSVMNSTESEYQGRFVESNNCYGIYDKEEFKLIIEKNFNEAYSAFQTSFIINYSNHILPISNVIKNPITFKSIFQSNAEVFKKLIKDFEKSEDILFEPSEYSLYYFFQEIINGESSLKKDWKSFITKNDYNKHSLNDAIKFFYMQLSSGYDANFIKILSESLKKSLPEIMKNVPDSHFSEYSIFCDIPMIHLWLELAINQLGYPYHQNTKNHKRFSYKAKERKMCLDIFTFDQCRSLYDWLPMIEYYGEDLKIIERQMLTRICIDAISKHNINILDKQYYGSALIGTNEKDWATNHFFEDRTELD